MFEILDNRSVLLLKGADALKFLQNFTTNDLKENKFSYNFLLNNQGRYLFDFFVFTKDNTELYLDCYNKQLDELKKLLTLYKLRSNLEIIDISEQYKVVYGKTRNSSYTDSSCKDLLSKSLYTLPDPRYVELGHRALVPISDISANKIDQQGLYLSDKYEYAIVDGAYDLEYEKSIPIEFGAEELNSLSYDKGCYVGQEVISRAKYQGVIRKKIYKLKFTTNITTNIPSTDIIDIDGNKIGKICSSYKNLAIAQIREEKYLGLKEKIAFVDGKQANIIIPKWRHKKA